LKKVAAITLIWILILACGAVWYFVLLRNPQESRSSQVKLIGDTFSGYYVFRSEEFKKKLAEKNIAYSWIEDDADYAKRMQSIKKGTTPYAVFTIDALVNQTPRDGDPPATIVMLIDETRGADAMVAYQRGVPNIAALNSPRGRVVLVPDSPSETLMRVIRQQFHLNQLPADRKKYLLPVEKAEEAYQMFLKARRSDPTAYVLWEPYVSLALKEPGTHRLIHSGSDECRGMIADVLVVQTDYLRKHQEEVLAVVESYLEVLNQDLATPDGLLRHLKLDAEIIKEPRVKDHAEAVVKGIWWKNTMENYAHFGLLPAGEAGSTPAVLDMIRNIIAVLRQTRGPDDPSPEVGRPDKLVDAEVLRLLYERKPRPLHHDQTIRRETAVVGPLAVNWESMVPVPEVIFDPPRIRFGSGGKLLPNAQDDLAMLAENLTEHRPSFCLRILGDAEKSGDPNANLAKARERAETVMQYLIVLGVPRERLQVVVDYKGEGKQVTFVVLQPR
jgi:outer membrane protein OmpA-like peptidoglycan-associated protein